MLHRDLERGLAGEGKLPGQKLVEHDPDRVDVGALVEGAPRACSGERYRAVPTIDPASVIWLAVVREMPKSVTLKGLAVLGPVLGEQDVAA